MRWFCAPELLEEIQGDLYESFYINVEKVGLNGVNFFLTLLLLLFVSSILAGVYPALFNSQLNPVSLVKGVVRVKGTNWLTRSLLLSIAYAHHINVSILPVILSSVIIFGAGILTTSSSIFKAAIANPVDALRNE